MAYILITGSEGLIGTQLSMFLESLGKSVRRFDIKYRVESGSQRAV